MFRPAAYRKAIFGLSEKPYRYLLLLSQVCSYNPTSGPLLILFQIIIGRSLKVGLDFQWGLHNNIIKNTVSSKNNILFFYQQLYVGVLEFF
jgi:hypothetical protein